MSLITRSQIVPYKPKDMYNLVNDINNYPKFLPWCTDASIDKENEDEIHATIHINKGPISKSFSTLNRLKPHKLIEMRLIDGPFKHLEGFWAFEALENSSKITLNLEFEFANKLIALALGPVFNQIASTMVESFCNRADAIYEG